MRFFISALLFFTVPLTKAGESERTIGNNPVFLHMLPTVTKTATITSSNVLVTLELTSHYTGKEFGELSERLGAVRDKDGHLRFRGLDYPSSNDKARAKHKEATFLIDYQDPVFTRIKKEIGAQIGARPTAHELAHYVATYITKKSLGHTHNIASKVAMTREGDCTEHAVLLAALMRLFGRAARLVDGLVVAEANGVVATFGHMWVEFHEGKKWLLADAAMINPEDQKELVKIIGYIPIHVQREEGPGFMRETLENFHPMHIKSVLIE